LFYALIATIFLNSQPYGTHHIADFADLSMCNDVADEAVEIMNTDPLSIPMTRELEQLLHTNDSVNSYTVILSCEPYREA
jgi:hypothetical protein